MNDIVILAMAWFSVLATVGVLIALLVVGLGSSTPLARVLQVMLVVLAVMGVVLSLAARAVMVGP